MQPAELQMFVFLWEDMSENETSPVVFAAETGWSSQELLNVTVSSHERPTEKC